ncbi:hypothetical protein YC2023_018042 [Brassica napus]
MLNPLWPGLEVVMAGTSAEVPLPPDHEAWFIMQTNAHGSYISSDVSYLMGSVSLVLLIGQHGEGLVIATSAASASFAASSPAVMAASTLETACSAAASASCAFMVQVGLGARKERTLSFPNDVPKCLLLWEAKRMGM